MKTLRRARPAEEREASAPESLPPAAVASRWTAGRSLASKAISALLLVAVAMGPVALVVAFWPRPPAVVQAAQTTPGLTEAEQTAGAYAASYVEAWLAATAEDPAALDTFVDVSSLRLGEQPAQFRQLQVASVTPQSGSLSSVVVTAFVNEPRGDSAEGEEPARAWLLRAFRVTVDAPQNGPLTVIGLPAPVHVATSTEALELAYDTSVPSAGPLTAAVQEFFDSYLAGVGDITRYTTPGTAIAAITPPPYVDVDVDVLAAEGDLPESITDGTELRLLAQLQLTSSDARTVAATYALTVVARDGQWEVSSLDTSPVLSTNH